MEKEKDPAAVALGKKRHAKMTPEEQRAFHQAGAKATNEIHRKKSPLERRFMAIKRARSQRLRLRSSQRSAVSSQPAPTGSPGEPPDTAELAALLETASDAALERLASTIGRTGAGKITLDQP